MKLMMEIVADNEYNFKILFIWSISKYGGRVGQYLKNYRGKKKVTKIDGLRRKCRYQDYSILGMIVYAWKWMHKEQLLLE